MTFSYRVVHYAPDPFTGARVPIGALVGDSSGLLGVATVQQLPDAECLGGTARAVAIRRLRDRLGDVSSLTRLPPVFGPYTQLADPRPVPEGVADPVAWVQERLAHVAAEPQRSKGPSRATPATYGFRFFETHGVARFVHKTFAPSRDGNWWGPHMATLPSITHWVGGRDDLLLLEPLVPHQPTFEATVDRVARNFGAWRHGIGAGGDAGPPTRFMAYLVPGGTTEAREHARQALRVFADDVIDTTVAAERDAFVHQVRQVGSGQEELA